MSTWGHAGFVYVVAGPRQVGKTTLVQQVLALDEIQKITGCPEMVKRLWDEDTARKVPLRVIILGSAPLFIRRGIADSLAGRFEVLHLPHWSFSEMKEAFGWPLERYLFHGGYPGAAPLAGDIRRWTRCVKNALTDGIPLEAFLSRPASHWVGG